MDNWQINSDPTERAENACVLPSLVTAGSVRLPCSEGLGGWVALRESITLALLVRAGSVRFNDGAWKKIEFVRLVQDAKKITLIIALDIP